MADVSSEDIRGRVVVKVLPPVHDPESGKKVADVLVRAYTRRLTLPGEITSHIPEEACKP